LAGVFDPLGLASPFIIKAKILTQQLRLLGLDWDDPIPNSHLTKWKAWLRRLPELELVSVPRCIQPKKKNVIESEIHTFCDALEEAFAAVVYLRSIYYDGDVRCSFLMAKTKVAPKKALSVARLELQAALLGARLANYVKEAMTRHIDRVFFWTDSKCVIGEDNWPKEMPVEELQQHEEIKPSKIFVAKSNPERAPVYADVDLERCSSLSKAQRVAALAHRFFNVCKGKKRKSSVVTVQELRVGLTALVRQCQREAFPDELQSLERTKSVSKRSKLLPFTPYLDENNECGYDRRPDEIETNDGEE
ncbi:Hypothetical predicted protein, partial [Paramuricea clavata]